MYIKQVVVFNMNVFSEEFPCWKSNCHCSGAGVKPELCWMYFGYINVLRVTLYFTLSFSSVCVSG